MKIIEANNVNEALMKGIKLIKKEGVKCIVKLILKQKKL